MVRDVLCDLDGVVWRSSDEIPGAVEALNQLDSFGARVWFVTNNSNRPVQEYEARLNQMGLTGSGRVLTSALAAATLVNHSMRVMVCAGPGVWEAVVDQGAIPVGAETAGISVDAVIVGLHREFDYVRLANASAAVRAGARLIGTNSDPTYPTPYGSAPGGGAILAAVSAAAATSPLLAGKPEEPMAQLVRRRLGDQWNPSTTVMIGDRPSTDGAFAQRLGIEYWAVGDLPAGESGDEFPTSRRAIDLSRLVDELPWISR